MHAKYEVSISYGSKVIAKVKVDNRKTVRQTNRQDKNNMPPISRSGGIKNNISIIRIALHDRGAVKNCHCLNLDGHQLNHSKCLWRPGSLMVVQPFSGRSLPVIDTMLPYTCITLNGMFVPVHFKLMLLVSDHILMVPLIYDNYPPLFAKKSCLLA